MSNEPNKKPPMELRYNGKQVYAWHDQQHEGDEAHRYRISVDGFATALVLIEPERFQTCLGSWRTRCTVHATLRPGYKLSIGPIPFPMTGGPRTCLREFIKLLADEDSGLWWEARSECDKQLRLLGHSQREIEQIRWDGVYAWQDRTWMKEAAAAAREITERMKAKAAA